jgi:hypothetical protein
MTSQRVHERHAKVLRERLRRRRTPHRSSVEPKVDRLLQRHRLLK